MLFQVAVLLGLVCGGTAAGDMFCTSVGLAPMMQALPYPRYVEMVQFLQPRYDPLMPVINTTALVANGTAAVLAPTAPARALFVLATTLVAAVIVVSVAKAVPINRFVLGLDPGREPQNWAARDPRGRWRAWNLTRTILMGGALVSGAAAVVGLL